IWPTGRNARAVTTLRLEHPHPARPLSDADYSRTPMQTRTQREQAYQLTCSESPVPTHLVHQDWNRGSGRVAIHRDIAGHLFDRQTQPVSNQVVNAIIGLVANEPIYLVESHVCLCAGGSDRRG